MPHSHFIVPANVGELTLGEQHLLGPDYSDDDRVPFTIYSFIIECDEGGLVLVDLGPKTLDYANRMFRHYNILRETGEDDIVQHYGNVFAHLERLGYEPADVTDIVFTHLHADHHGIDDATDAGACLDFPNATFHVSRIGWEDNLAHRRDGQWGSYVDFAFSDFLLEGGESGRVRFHDNAEIRNGIRTHYMGGHSVCNQAILVETGTGLAVMSGDDVYTWEFLEGGILPSLHTTPERLLDSTDYLTNLVDREGAILLPNHDPNLWRYYQDAGTNWLQVARIRSMQAAYHYRDKRAAIGHNQ